MTTDESEPTLTIEQSAGAGTGSPSLDDAWLDVPVVITGGAVTVLDVSSGLNVVVSAATSDGATLTATGIAGGARVAIGETVRVILWTRDSDGAQLVAAVPGLLGEAPGERNGSRSYVTAHETLLRAAGATTADIAEANENADAALAASAAAASAVTALGTRVGELEAEPGADRPYAPAPVVVSAAVNASALSTLTVVWDRDVVHAPLDGLALNPADAEIVDVSAGGEGTSTSTYTLDAELTIGETYTFTIAADNAVRSTLGAIATAGSEDFTIAPLAPPEFELAFIVTDDRDRMRLRFNEAVTLADISLVSITPTGTARTVASLVSGDGTRELTFALSGDLDAPSTVLVSLADGAVASVATEAEIRAVAIHARECMPLTVANGIDFARLAVDAQSSGIWPAAEDDAVVLSTSTGTISDTANGYEGYPIKSFRKAEDDRLIITTPGSNQVGAMVSAAAWNLWCVAIPKSLGTDSPDTAHYNNEGWIGAQNTFGIAVRSGASIGDDSARAQVNHLSGGSAYLATECPIKLFGANLVRGRLAGGNLYARRDLSPTESGKASGNTPLSSAVFFGCTSNGGATDADVDMLAVVSSKTDLAAYRKDGVVGAFMAEPWGDFLRPLPAFPSRHCAIVGQATSVVLQAAVCMGDHSGIELSADIGTCDATGWTHTFGAAGEYEVTFTITDANDDRILRVCRMPVIVSPASAAGEVYRVWPIGDSNVASATLVARIRTALAAQGATVSMLGTLGSAPNKHDGTGGWAWIHTLTGLSGTGSQFSTTGATYDRVATAISELGAVPTHVIINLGTNDNFSYYTTYGENPTTFAARLATVSAQREAFIAALRAQLPGVPIIVHDPLPINSRQSAFTANYDSPTPGTIPQWGVRRMMHRYQVAQTAALRNRESEGIYLGSTAAVDPVAGFDATNAAHPLTAALQALGDQDAAAIRAT